MHLATVLEVAVAVGSTCGVANLVEEKDMQRPNAVVEANILAGIVTVGIAVVAFAVEPVVDFAAAAAAVVRVAAKDMFVDFDILVAQVVHDTVGLVWYIEIGLVEVDTLCFENGLVADVVAPAGGADEDVADEDVADEDVAVG
jgi:hypothetical protein